MFPMSQAMVQTRLLADAKASDERSLGTLARSPDFDFHFGCFDLRMGHPLVIPCDNKVHQYLPGHLIDSLHANIGGR